MAHRIPLSVRRRLLAALALSALCAVGAVAALSLAPAASAWSITSLPPGWTIEHDTNVGAAVCPDSYRIWNADRTVFSDLFCTDSPTFQADFDAWVDAHYTPPATTTDTTTAATTTTAQTDTTTTAAPTTTPASTAPDLQSQIDGLAARVAMLQQELVALVRTLEQWPGIDPGILAQLMSLSS